MKIVKLKNHYQLVKEVPKEWQKLPVYNVIMPTLGVHQKYCEIKDAEINEETNTIILSVVDLTAEQITARNKKEQFIISEQLKEVVATLHLGAKRIAIGKDGTKNYIESQERLYFRKYQIAKGELSDFNNLLQNEAIEFGMTYEAYKSLIIQKYDEGLAAFNMFLSMIERARSKVVYFLDNRQIHKAKEVLILMKSITTETSLEDIQGIMQTIVNYK